MFTLLQAVLGLVCILGLRKLFSKFILRLNYDRAQHTRSLMWFVVLLRLVASLAHRGTHPGRCLSVARMGLGQNWGSAGQTKGTEILHLVNDEHLVGWWHHWPTGAVPIAREPSRHHLGVPSWAQA